MLRHKLLSLAAIPTALLLVVSDVASAQVEQASLLERVRAAVGQDSLRAAKGGFVARGTAHESGMDYEVEYLFRPDGSYRSELRGELSSTNGSDGKIPWARDSAGLTHQIAPSGRETLTIRSAIFGAHWLWGKPFRIEPAEDGEHGPALTVQGPSGKFAVTVDIDRDTALPTGFRFLSAAGPISWRFEDWRTARGFAFPHVWRQFEGENEVATYHFATLEPAPHYFVDPCAFRATVPDDVTWDDSAEIELEAKRIPTGHILVRPLVDGSDLGWFIFDTGAAAMCIDALAADELGLSEFGEVTALGAVGKTSASFRRGKTFTLGQLTIHSPVYVELDLAPIAAALREPIAGIVGYDVFARALIEIEVQEARIALMRREDYGELEGEWQELILLDKHPCVIASFEGNREGLFKIDTGASGTVAFHAPAVKALKLLEGRNVWDTSSAGVGGAAASKQGILQWFELGGHRFKKPSVNFSLSEIGAFASTETVGNIGQEFLNPFRLVIDYQGKRLAFLKRQ